MQPDTRNRDSLLRQSSRHQGRFVIEYVERSEGPLHKTHHWHATLWFEDEMVLDGWCATREIAFDEVACALERAGEVA